MNIPYTLKLLAVGVWHSLANAIIELCIQMPFVLFALFLFYLISCNWTVTLLLTDMVLIALMRASTPKKNYDYLLGLLPKIGSMMLLSWILLMLFERLCNYVGQFQYLVKILFLIQLHCPANLIFFSPLIFVICFLLIETPLYKLDLFLKPNLFYALVMCYPVSFVLYAGMSIISGLFSYFALGTAVSFALTLLVHYVMIAVISAAATLSLHSYDEYVQLG